MGDERRLDLGVAQRELTEALVEALFAAAPFGIALFDRTLTFVRVNEFIARLNGLPAADHPGRRFADVVGPEISELVEPLLRRVVDTGEPVADVKVSQIQERTTARMVHTAAVYYPLLGHGGDVIGVGSIVLDVTELRHLEEQLQRSQRLEAVGLLAGGVAHDFNNLLTVISGHAALALAALPEGGPGRDDVQSTVRAADRAADVVRSLLAFARQAVLHPQPVDLDAMTRELAMLLRPMLGAPIELVLEPGGARGHALVDPVQLEQVLVNLAVNARDAMPDGGKLVMRTLTVDVGVDEASTTLRPGRYVGVSMADTGGGMDDETIGKVFQPFFTTKATDGGTGLGLSTAHGIVAQSGGEIRVVSAPGAGTTFTVLLPATDPAPAARASADAEEPGLGSETILLVEDEEMLCTLVERQLVRLGYAVVSAASGEQAFQLMAELGGKVDLVVTDVSMPGMAGYELVRRLRRKWPDVRAIYMSGYAADPGVGAEMGEFIAKPFSLEALGHAVRRELDRPG